MTAPVQLEIPGAEAPEKAPPLEPARRRGRPPGSTNKPKAEASPEPPDKEQVAAAWRGLFFLIKIVAGIFGFEAIDLDEHGQLPEAEAKEDAKSLRLIPGLHRLTFLGWIAAPIVILQRVTQHFRRRPKAPATTTQGAPSVPAGPPPVPPAPSEGAPLA